MDRRTVFSGAKSLRSIDLNRLDTSSVVEAEDVYDFIVAPYFNNPEILFVEFIYYKKEMPDWYKDYAAEVQAVTDCISARSPLLDIYVKKADEANQITRETTVDDVMDAGMNCLSELRQYDEKMRPKKSGRKKSFIIKIKKP